MYGSFPQRRLRRLRMLPQLRDLVRETHLSINDLMYPLFVVPGKGVKKEVSAMPGVYNFSIDKLIEEIKQVYDLGIKAVILFGIPEKKDEQASEAYSPSGVIQQGTKAIKQEVKDIVVITDVCLCEYTSHGHCGMVKNGVIDNDATLDLLAKSALSQVQAGADIVAPSDMMDGRVRRIRETLDENGFELIPIMSYAAKYASAFYGPFREAAQSAPAFGDRRSHQMDPANVREAELEILLDLQEGADIIMVKPALVYLDVIQRVKQKYLVPVAAYNVSGEYAMIKAAGAKGWIDPEATMWECLLSIKRAGADLILTYFAKEVAKKLAQK